MFTILCEIDAVDDSCWGFSQGSRRCGLCLFFISLFYPKEKFFSFIIFFLWDVWLNIFKFSSRRITVARQEATKIFFLWTKSRGREARTLPFILLSWRSYSVETKDSPVRHLQELASGSWCMDLILKFGSRRIAIVRQNPSEIKIMIFIQARVEYLDFRH